LIITGKPAPHDVDIGIDDRARLQPQHGHLDYCKADILQVLGQRSGAFYGTGINHYW
jgi:hypothetical protein